MCVPDMYREGSFGLGAGRLRTVTHIVLPTAIPGILSGIILAIGRIVGETAALMYTSGTVEKVAGLMDSGSTLALHMYKQASEGLYTEQAYATSVILLALVLVLGIGINYTLFFSNPRGTPLTSLLAITLAMLTTLLTLGMLVFSATQAISSFGIVLVSGIFTAFLLSPLAMPDKKRTKK